MAYTFGHRFGRYIFCIGWVCFGAAFYIFHNNTIYGVLVGAVAIPFVLIFLRQRVEIKLSKESIKSSKNDINKYNSEIAECRKEIDELNKEIKKTESDIKEAQANLTKAEKKLAELTRKA